MSSCSERLGDRVRAEAVLREAMTAIRDAGDRLDAAAKKAHLDDVMGRLKRLAGCGDMVTQVHWSLREKTYLRNLSEERRSSTLSTHTTR